MVSCIVCGTSRTINPKNVENPVTFHVFPKDPLQRQIWIKFVKKMNWQPTSRSLICSKHFADNCFDKSSPTLIRLKPQSVPTISVQRVKYVRSFKTEILTDTAAGPTPISETTSTLDFPLNLPSSVPSTSISRSDNYVEIGSSASTTSMSVPDVSFTPAVGDSPRIESLKRTLRKLLELNQLKSKKIRQVQKENWRLKKKIENLQKVVKYSSYKEENTSEELRNEENSSEISEALMDHDYYL